MKNSRIWQRKLRETSVLSLRVACRMGRGRASVTMLIGGEDLVDEGRDLERNRQV